MNFEVEAIVVLLNPVLSIVPVSRYMYVELVPEICKRVFMCMISFKPKRFPNQRLSAGDRAQKFIVNFEVSVQQSKDFTIRTYQKLCTF